VTSKEHRYDGDCRLAVQAVCRGQLDSKVLAVTAAASKHGHPVVCVRVGRVLVYVEDRAALESFTDAWQLAAKLGDQVMPPPPDPLALAEARARRDFERGRRSRP
jgi:hypothetical protein